MLDYIKQKAEKLESNCVCLYLCHYALVDLGTRHNTRVQYIGDFNHDHLLLSTKLTSDKSVSLKAYEGLWTHFLLLPSLRKETSSTSHYFLCHRCRHCSKTDWKQSKVQDKQRPVLQRYLVLKKALPFFTC